MDFVQIFGVSQYSFESLSLAFGYSGKPRSNGVFLVHLDHVFDRTCSARPHRSGQLLYKLSDSGEKRPPSYLQSPISSICASINFAIWTISPGALRATLPPLGRADSSNSRWVLHRAPETLSRYAKTNAPRGEVRRFWPARTIFREKSNRESR
jgi:hypothetical protein